MEEELIKEESSPEVKWGRAHHDKIIKVDNAVKEQIMKALSARNPGKNIIGLYGQYPKVVVCIKTAARRAHRDQLFQEIVKVNMANKPHLRNIQSKIGAAIGLSFVDDDEDPGCFVFFAKNKRMSTVERASLLCAKMKELETVLVVLYDLHDGFDLDKLVFPLLKIIRPGLQDIAYIFKL